MTHEILECPCLHSVDNSGPHIEGCRYDFEAESDSELHLIPAAVVDSEVAELRSLLRLATATLRDLTASAPRAAQVLQEIELAMDRLGS